MQELQKHYADIVSSTQDSEFTADASENSNRDAIIRDKRSFEQSIGEFRKVMEIVNQPVIPGTVGMDDVVRVTYLSIVSEGERLQTPLIGNTFFAKLHATLKASGHPVGQYSKEQPYSIPLTSILGEAIHGKALGTLRLATPTGYVEVEVKI
jgi:hypothetical protein